MYDQLLALFVYIALTMMADCALMFYKNILIQLESRESFYACLHHESLTLYNFVFPFFNKQLHSSLEIHT